MGFLGDITGPIGGLIGGELDRQHDARQDAKQRQYQGEINAANAALQREFAQMGIRWKVEDAKAAGIHPLAALGATTVGASPSYVAGDGFSARSNYRQMGQDVGRAISAVATREERALRQIQVESARTDLEMKKIELERMRGTGPGFPSLSGDTYLSGQGDGVNKALGLDPRVIDEPYRRTVADPMDKSKEAGAMTDWQMVKTKTGYAVVPSRDVKQAIEDSPMEYQWLIRAAKRTYRLPDGRPARMNPLTGELKPLGPRSFFREVLDKFWEGPFGILRSE